MPRAVRCLVLFSIVSLASVAVGQDVTSPSVVSTDPPDGSSDVDISLATVFIQFDEQMDRDSFVDNVYLTEGAAADGERVVLARTHTGGTYCGLEPADAFTPQATYGIHVTTGVTDLAGNALAAPWAGVFTTAANDDTDPPLVVLTAPLAGAIDVPVGLTTVQVEFNESMDPASLAAAVFLRVGLTADGPEVAVTGQSVDGGTCTLTPAAALAPGTVHSLHVTGEAADLAGNPLADDFSCSFRTVAAGPDLAAPFVTSTSPPDGAGDVPRDLPSVRIDFNELMTIESFAGNITVSGPGAAVADLVEGVSHVTVVLAGTLTASAAYTVEVGTGVIDLAGNPLAAPHSVTFTTSDEVPGERTSWGGLKASYR